MEIMISSYDWVKSHVFNDFDDRLMSYLSFRCVFWSVCLFLCVDQAKALPSGNEYFRKSICLIMSLEK